MERRGSDISLVERIVSAGRPAVLVCSPAACGKTTAALGVYGRYLDEAGRPRCLLLAPNAPAAGYLRRRLLEAAPGGVAISPGVLTFAALAGRVLAAAREPARPVSAFRRRLLLGEVVAELHAGGQLAALGPVADTPGLVVTLDRALAELKRAAVEPDELARAVGPGKDRRADLVAVYRLYQRRLREQQFYDTEGQMWLAREHLRAAAQAGTPLPGLEGVAAVAADGFTDFTPTQLEILALLAGRLERVVITLPFADDGRVRMWHWTERTLRNIREHFGANIEEVFPAVGAEAPGAGGPAPSLRALWEQVFHADGRCAPPGELSVIAACGVDAEVAAVARRVKALLLAGAAAGSIAVLARSLKDYDEPIRRILAENEIPAGQSHGALTDAPIVRFALDAAALAPELEWRAVLRVLKSSYFRPQALGAYDEATVVAAEHLIREGNVLSGREAYAAAAQRLAARARRRQGRAAERDEEDAAAGPAPHEPSAEAVEQAGRMLEALFDLAARAGGAGDLAGLIDALELPQAAAAHDEPDLIARDLRAVAALHEHLRDLPDPPPPAAAVREALSAVPCPPARAEALVDVLDVLDARALRYDHVFLVGLSERQFPQQPREDALTGQQDREAWLRRGVVLDSRRDLTAREMLLFYLAASRADRALTVSYLESDASGQVGSPSSFLLALLDPAGGLEAVEAERIAPGQLVPPPDRLAGSRDAFNAAVCGLFSREQAAAPPAMAWAARCAPRKLLACARGLWAHHRRWQPGECNEFDGRISDPVLLKALAERYPRRAVFSAGQLGAYGQCPWQYFATYVLRLSPLAEPQRRLEPQTRGTFCHDVLFRLMRSLAEEGGGEARLAEIDDQRLAGALDAAVADEARAVEARRPPYPVLWQVQLRQMRQALWEYLQAARERPELDAAGRHFELAFGQEMRPDEARDPASRDEPVTLDTPGGPVRLRGRIDRVDRVRFEGLDGLLVVDYKTGRLPGEPDLAAGRNLQMPLYAAAAQAILGRPCLGGVFQHVGAAPSPFERFFAAVTTSRGAQSYKADEGYEQKRQAAMETVARFVRGMARGAFDLAPTDGCPSYCPFRQVCHHSPARAARKGPPPAEEETG